MFKNAENHNLGRGRLFIDLFAPGSTVRSGRERYIGNTPNFSLSASAEKKDHYSSDSKVKVKDRSVLISVDHMGKFTTDQIDVDNVAMFLLGEGSEVTQAAVAAGATITAKVSKGYHVQIGQTETNSGGLRGLTVSAVAPGVANVDYVLDAEAGRIFFPTTSALADGSNVTITYAAAAQTRSRVVSGNTEIRCALRFEADNAEGENANYYMRNVRLMPDGEFLLKGDEWQEIAFNAECLTLGNLPAVARNGAPFI